MDHHRLFGLYAIIIGNNFYTIVARLHVREEDAVITFFVRLPSASIDAITISCLFGVLIVEL